MFTCMELALTLGGIILVAVAVFVAGLLLGYDMGFTTAAKRMGATRGTSTPRADKSRGETPALGAGSGGFDAHIRHCSRPECRTNHHLQLPFAERVQ